VLKANDDHKLHIENLEEIDIFNSDTITKIQECLKVGVGISGGGLSSKFFSSCLTRLVEFIPTKKGILTFWKKYLERYLFSELTDLKPAQKLNNLQNGFALAHLLFAKVKSSYPSYDKLAVLLLGSPKFMKVWLKNLLSSKCPLHNTAIELEKKLIEVILLEE
jgi:hypothetical protein